jgi:hypothetical protein
MEVMILIAIMLALAEETMLSELVKDSNNGLLLNSMETATKPLTLSTSQS